METSRTRRFGAARRLATVLAGATLALGGLAATPSPPAGAAATDSDTLVWVPYRGQTFGFSRNGTQGYASYTSGDFRGGEALEGDFTDTPGTDVFWYRPGPAPDGIVDVVPDGTGVDATFIPKSVNGTFTPLVGDFDGNAVDDILWYAPGSSADALWLFAGDGTHTNVPLTINGSYVPTVIEANGDGYDDIVWYAPGPAADSMWLFGSGASKTTKSVSINGSYQLIPGYFGVRPEGSPQQRLLFFNPTGPDSIWTFDTAANHTSAATPNVDGAFQPVVGAFTSQVTEAIVWYRPGSASEAFWSFSNAGAVNQLEPANVSGSYDPAVADVDGNGYDDIAWSSGGNAAIWRFNGGGYTQTSVSSGLPNTTLVASHTNPFGVD